MAEISKDKQDDKLRKEDRDFVDTAAIEAGEIDEFSDEEQEEEFSPDKLVGIDSVEIDVEQILSEIAAEVNTGNTANIRVRRQLEAMLERKRERQRLIDFEEYDIDS